MSASTQSLPWPESGHVNQLTLDELPLRRDDLIHYFRRTRETSLSFSQPLSAEDQMLQGMAEASPNKWHLAHTTWFFETFLLQPYLQNYRVFHV